MANFEDIINISVYGLMNFLVLILLIVTIVKLKNKELEPDCEKGFSKFFVMFLIFLMFSTFFDFVYMVSTFFFVFNVRFPIPEIDFAFFKIGDTLWGIKEGLVFFNLFIALLLLFLSMEVKLFNKKSKFKFGILAIILLCGSFLYMVAKIIMYYASYESRIIAGLVLSVLTNFNYILIAVFILILLKKTSKENPSLKIYSKPLSAGTVLLFIIRPLFLAPLKILQLVSYFSSRFDIFEDEGLWIVLSLFYIASFLFIIGIILLTKGALKTMFVPLTFAREKKPKEIQQKSTNECSECGAFIAPGLDFCTNCGNKR